MDPTTMMQMGLAVLFSAGGTGGLVGLIVTKAILGLNLKIEQRFTEERDRADERYVRRHEIVPSTAQQPRA